MSDDEIKDISDEEFLDEEFEDEAWEEEGDGTGIEDSDAPVAKKKSSKFNFILIVCAVLGGGGFFLMKSGGKAPLPVEAQQPALPEMAAIPAQEQTQEIVQSAEKKPEEEEQKLSGGFLKDPSAFDKVEQMHDEMQFEDYNQDRDTEAWRLGEDDATAVHPAQEPLTPMPDASVQQAAAQPVPPIVQSDLPPPDFPKAQDGVISTAEATAQVSTQKTESNQEQNDTSSINEKLVDLGGRMDELESAFESLEIPAGSGKEIADLKAALLRLESKVDNLAKSGIVSAAPAVQKSTPVKTSAISSITSPAAVKVPAKVKNELVSWVLKSAQPGKAIVSKAGQGEVYSVSVGDKLEGVGKITSVEQQNGVWVVQGSAGKITQ